MKEQVLGVIMLTLIIFANAKLTKEDDDSNLDLFEDSLFRRYLLDEYRSFKHRETPTFDEDHRKFQQEALDAHNLFRALHCVSPLTLDEEINIRAQIYAEYLASQDGELIHSSNRNGLFGENLYALTRSSPITNPDGNKTTRSWYSEVSRYDYNNPGYAKNIAHFSQLVWKDTQRLGIGYAFARKGLKMFVVANYAPPGNYGFAYSTNVLQPNC